MRPTQSAAIRVLLLLCILCRGTLSFAPILRRSQRNHANKQRTKESGENCFALPSPLNLVTSQQTSHATTTASSSPSPSHTRRQPLPLSASPLSSSYEALRERLPRTEVVDAVAASSSSGKIVASDVAAAAGVSLAEASRDLVALAALSRADLSVSQDGEIVYDFPSNLKGALAQNSAKYKAVQTLQKAWPAVFWVVRVSFGVALLASLLAIFSTILFIQTSGESNDDRRRDNRGGFGGGLGGMGSYWGPSPFDVFLYRPYGTYGYYGTASARDPEEMGFLESVFSYIFGDGDPNAGLETKRLQLAASMIRENQGAVNAEQLAPFLDDAPSPQTAEDSTYVDESYVLPVVSALGGEPVVTEDGEIVYVFSELQTSASSSPKLGAIETKLGKEASILKRAGMKTSSSVNDIVQVLKYNGISTRGAVEKGELIDLLEAALPPMSPSEEAAILESDPSLLQEREWRFSVAPDLNKYLAGGLGVVNLGGALYLGSLLGQYRAYGVQLPEFFGTVQAFYPLLLGYAVLFNIIPVARNFWVKSQNEKIRQRNKRRTSWKKALASAARGGGNRIAKKLKAASQYKTRLRKIGKKDILYDTSKPMEENSLRKEQQSLEDFDKMLGMDDNTFQ